MTDLRAAAQQALDALYDIDATGVPVGHIDLVIDTLKAALAQQEQDITPAELSAALGWPGGISTPVLGKVELLRMVAGSREEQEPVALAHKHEWFRTGSMEPGQFRCIHCGIWAKETEPAPPRREWQSLTDEEISAVDWDANGTLHDYARAVEQACKEKNNG